MISRDVGWLSVWVAGGRVRAGCVGVASAMLVLLAPAAVARSAPDSFADLAERLSPSVVIVTTTQQARGRSAARPGITGRAQIEAGYAEGLAATARKALYDRIYVGQASIALDLYILVGTLRVLVRGAGAK